MQRHSARRGLKKKTRRIMIGVLVAIIMTFYAAAAFVRWVDPWGLGRYRTDLHNMTLTFSPDAERLYKFTPGEYQFSNWSMTVNQDGNRRVVNTNRNANCTMALLGDSITMAWGVSDAETWPTILAERHPDVHIINTGVAGYDIEQIYSVYKATKADGYFYLMIYNDAEIRESWERPVEAEHIEWQWPSVGDYLYVFLMFNYGLDASSSDLSVFDELWEELSADDNLLAVGLMNHDLVKRTGVPFIPLYQHKISYMDSHANAEGNMEIANALEPYFEQLKTRVCAV